MNQKAQQPQHLFHPLKGLDLFTVSRPTGSTAEQDVVFCFSRDCQEGPKKNITWKFKRLETVK